jgi:lipopolysaccharide transport system ATP-binding protein
MKPAVRVENISKVYRLGATKRRGYRTLRETIAGAFAAPRKRLRSWTGFSSSNNGQAAPDTIWALRDVSLKIQQGEVVGIIGRNGAGKSTLLKILSRVTEPTAGRAELRGRIGSLLEVGTGFHAELTGRENVYLSGAVLGMTRREIARRFDEIVAFAELDRFLDTPVKHYSSGMYVRLAFAVAAHLEPEILVIDEVLAVGDAGFQNKCLQRMEDAGREGRTILFVSHNLAAMQRLCRRGIVLEHGRLAMDSPMREAAARYVHSIESVATADLAQRTDRRGVGQVRLIEVEVKGDGSHVPGQLLMGHSAQLVFRLGGCISDVTCIFNIVNAAGQVVTRFNSGLRNLQDTTAANQEPVLACTVDEMLLAPGRYRVDAALWLGSELQDSIEGADFFEVLASPVRGRETPRTVGDWVVCLPHHWQYIA